MISMPGTLGEWIESVELGTDLMSTTRRRAK